MINHQIVAIPSDNNSLIESLAISEERSTEILKFLDKTFARDDLNSKTEFMEAAT